MLSIAYVSVAVEPMSDAEMADLLTRSRANNIQHEITGALLYRRGRFIQIFEGPTEQVKATFRVIAADSRHRNVQKISEKSIGARQFPDWTMGFEPESDVSVMHLDGFDDFFGSHTGRARLERAENEAQQMLEWLGEYWFASA